MVYHQNQSICLDSKDLQTHNVKSFFFAKHRNANQRSKFSGQRSKCCLSYMFLHSLVTVIMPIYDVVRKLPLEKVPVDASAPEQVPLLTQITPRKFHLLKQLAM
ncbi:hypothetical protein BRARA_G00306 [Brassica rapa]|uniref:Uncharacterized protein n=1 Tax=Brassica campestris TaxID=3711 RepID=A0A397YSB6_BRACM|nr:hypothetical protein BRARA_G00306 [Brassica rapa]